MEWQSKHPYYCVDCGTKITYKRTRCRPCALKERYKNLPEHGKERQLSRQRTYRENNIWWDKEPCPKCDKPMHRGAKTCIQCRPSVAANGKGFNWKGGKVKDGNGYILIYNPHDLRANKTGYIREHLLVWEQISGKPLPKEWHIHHLNGIKSDNRPANLVGLPSKKHYLVLAAKAKRIQELEGLLKHQPPLL